MSNSRELLTKAMKIIYDYSVADNSGGEYRAKCICCGESVCDEDCEINQLEKDYENLLREELAQINKFL